MTIDKLNDNELIIGGYSNSNVSGDKNENSVIMIIGYLKLMETALSFWQKTIGGFQMWIF
ncbi:MAG: hypothetical protein U0T80_08915 [Flavobacteriaceae bacterium]